MAEKRKKDQGLRKINLKDGEAENANELDELHLTGNKTEESKDSTEESKASKIDESKAPFQRPFTRDTV